MRKISAVVVMILVALGLYIASCSTTSTLDSQKDISVFPFLGDPNSRRSIFVFLDGTNNDADSRTNVWWLYKFVESKGDRQATGLYIQGVGTDHKRFSGAALGRGMEDRISEAHNFISKNYRNGDRIYLFGFSRGAHQARAVAGLISYVGVISHDQAQANASHRLVELLKKKIEADYSSAWAHWIRGQPPFLQTEIEIDLGLKTQYAEVQFMGLWDTVPGSSFKSYVNNCKENIGPYKRWLWWLPGIDRGERYKSDTYPNIRNIAHAVSRDENRSKFSLLPVCPAISSGENEIEEVWFPGAHSDVGGGYADGRDQLSDISLEWMIRRLDPHYTVSPSRALHSDYSGLAHWPICDSPGNKGSDCEDRIPNDGWVPHASIAERESLESVEMMWKDRRVRAQYPVRCKKDTSRRANCGAAPD